MCIAQSPPNPSQRLAPVWDPLCATKTDVPRKCP
ncbi:hypothetical protein CGRA01v4_07020 [Colletotrichum graminicola]|nr:hypothetical protein CGRA01v4_07020 [Colletotrichum graminicola]